MLIRRWALAALTLVGLVLFTATPARAADPDKYFPDGTNLVVQVNINQLLGANLLQKGIPLAAQKYGDALLKLAADRIPDEQARGMVEAFGPQMIQVISDEATVGRFMNQGKEFVQDFVFAGNTKDEVNGSPQIIMMIRSSRLDPSMLEQFAGMAGGNPQVELKEEKVGDVVVYEMKSPQQPQPIFFCAPEDGIIVFTPFKNVLTTALKNKGKGKLDPKFKALLGQRKASYSVFAAGLAPKGKSDEVKEFVATLTVDKDVKGQVTVDCRDAETAQEQVKKVNEEIDQALAKIKDFASQRPELKPVAEALKSAQAKADGSTVKASLLIKGDALLKAMRDAK